MSMLTYTDRVVLPVGTPPGVIDIAVSLSRQPRFGGHTRRWWSVLDHLLFVDKLAASTDPRRLCLSPAQLPLLRLALLLHDAHEAITSDVPTDAKGPDLRRLQTALDRVIADRYFPGGWTAYESWETDVKEFDRLALVAEAHVVGPPVGATRLVEVEPRFAAESDRERDAVQLLTGLLRGATYLGVPPRVQDQGSHPAVREYLNRMVRLM